MNRKPLLVLSFISLTLLALACTQVDVNGLDPDLFTNSGGGGGTTDLCNGVESDFSTKVLPIFADKCAGSGCHTQTGAGGGLNLDDSDNRRGDGASGVIGNIKTEGAINAFSAEQSALLLKPLATAEGGQSGTHTGGQIFANKVDENYKTILCWIEGGAKNDLDDSKCTFGEHVYPIFGKRTCTNNCHTTANAATAGNLNFTLSSVQLLTDNPNATASFADATAQPVATGGDLTSLILTKPSETNGVTHDGGQIFQSTTDKDYQTIKCWLEEGAQNN